MDNIGHNTSSTSAHDSFHDTGISLLQHPNRDVRGAPQIYYYRHPDDTVTITAHNVCIFRSHSTRLDFLWFACWGKCDPPVPKLEGPNRSDCHLSGNADSDFRCTVTSDAPYQGDQAVSWRGRGGEGGLPCKQTDNTR